MWRCDASVEEDCGGSVLPEAVVQRFGSEDEVLTQVPTQAQSLVEGSGTAVVSQLKPIPDLDYLQVGLWCALYLFICAHPMLMLWGKR